MDKKPIKRSTEIMPLSQEHHFSLLFSWKIKQGLKNEVSLERIIRYVNFFWENNLRLHFEREEIVLFNQFRHDSDVAKALSEHEETKKIIDFLNSKQGSVSEQKNRLEKLAEMITTHVRMEERELFPALEKRLSKEGLERAAEVLRDLHEPAKDNDYDDDFWLKKTDDDN